MKPDTISNNNENTVRNIFLLLLLTILIIYVAVPFYGIIRDKQSGEAVFRIEYPQSGVGESLRDKVRAFFFGSSEIPVSVLHIFDLEGTVVYTDNTPYANGIVELRSAPRYTRTTEDGYFIFKTVEAGRHTINVLDGAGHIIASCDVDVSIGSNASSNARVSKSGDSYTIHVPVNITTLAIRLVLKTGADGKVQEIGSLEVVNAADGSAVRPQVPAGGTPPGTGQPQLPDDNIPPPSGNETPASPAEGSAEAGRETPRSTPRPFRFAVYDSNVSFGSEAVRINIFGANKRIAPGQQGSYRFTVDNTRNSDSSLYTVKFTAQDTFPAGRKLPIVYRLKAGTSYVAGNAALWCDPEQLYQDRVVAENGSVVYTLEWYWPESDYDNLYAEFSGNAEYSYSLRIEVTAQRN